jgi:hypothetical protein
MFNANHFLYLQLRLYLLTLLNEKEMKSNHSLYNYYCLGELKSKFHRLDIFRSERLPLLQSNGAIVIEPIKNRYDIIFNGQEYRYNCNKDTLWRKEGNKTWRSGWMKLKQLIIKGYEI